MDWLRRPKANSKLVSYIKKKFKEQNFIIINHIHAFSKFEINREEKITFPNFFQRSQ
jgi:hypothetical protein